MSGTPMVIKISAYKYTELLFAILISAKAACKTRVDPGCARFVPESGQNIHLPLSKKKASDAIRGRSRHTAGCSFIPRSTESQVFSIHGAPGCGIHRRVTVE